MSDILLAEVEAYQPGGGPGARYASSLRAAGMPPPLPQQLEASTLLRASDSGYRSHGSDPQGVQAYPPTLEAALGITVALNLAPGQSAAGWAAGALRLANDDGRYDLIEASHNVDRRPVRILLGHRQEDPRRGLETDPPYSALALMWAGLAQPWWSGEDQLVIPLRDATYWLEKPLQAALYAGTGGYEGTAELAGRAKPKVRGGRPGNPVPNVSPVLIDPVSLIWQVSDGPGQVYFVYTGGATNLTRAADTGDLYSGTCPAGSYRVCSRPDGLYLQLGSPLPSGWQLTCDVVGHFPLAGAAHRALDLVRLLMLEEAGLPATLVDSAAFTAASATVPGPAGDYWPEPVSAIDAIAPLLASVGAHLVPRDDGRLSVLLLRAPSATATPAAHLTEDTILDAAAEELPAEVNPPPWRWLVTYSRNHTVQTANLDPDVSEARRLYLAGQDRYGQWQDQALLLAYRDPNNPEPVQTRLLAAADAFAMASAWGALWGTSRALYRLDLDLRDGWARQLGELVRITYPLGRLRRGARGIVVGKAVQGEERLVTLKVLI